MITFRTSTDIPADRQVKLTLPPEVPTGRAELVVSVADTQREEHDPALERRFQELTREWKQAHAITSSVSEMATHPAYQQIIGLGKQAIPLILAELRQQPDHWFWALKAITGVDPVLPADRGKMTRMALAWLDWAHHQGY
jgi:hypothetical protein